MITFPWLANISVAIIDTIFVHNYSHQNDQTTPSKCIYIYVHHSLFFHFCFLFSFKNDIAGVEHSLLFCREMESESPEFNLHPRYFELNYCDFMKNIFFFSEGMLMNPAICLVLMQSYLCQQAQ